MAILDLFKKRQPHIIYLDVNGEKRAYKIPVQYTVEEVERILEIQVKIDDLKATEVEVNSQDQIEMFKKFWDHIYSQLLILFNHYQPDIELDFLKNHVDKEDALDIIAFHTAEHLSNVEEEAKRSKKKATKKN